MTYSSETIKLLENAVKEVLEYPFGGYWPFIKPCQDALNAVEKERMDQICCPACKSYDITALWMECPLNNKIPQAFRFKCTCDHVFIASIMTRKTYPVKFLITSSKNV